MSLFKMKLQVELENGEKVTVTIDNAESISAIKNYLSNNLKVPVESINIFSNNHELDNSYTLKNAEDSENACLLCKISADSSFPEKNLIPSIPDPEKVKYITNMGFNEEIVKSALAKNENDVEKTISILKSDSQTVRALEVIPESQDKHLDSPLVDSNLVQMRAESTDDAPDLLREEKADENSEEENLIKQPIKTEEQDDEEHDKSEEAKEEENLINVPVETEEKEEEHNKSEEAKEEENLIQEPTKTEENEEKEEEHDKLEETKEEENLIQEPIETEEKKKEQKETKRAKSKAEKEEQLQTSLDLIDRIKMRRSLKIVKMEEEQKSKKAKPNKKAKEIKLLPLKSDDDESKSDNEDYSEMDEPVLIGRSESTEIKTSDDEENTKKESKIKADKEESSEKLEEEESVPLKRRNIPKKRGRKSKSDENNEEEEEVKEKKKKIIAKNWSATEDKTLKDYLLNNAPVDKDKWKKLADKILNRSVKEVQARYAVLKMSGEITKDEAKIIVPEVSFKVEDGVFGEGEEYDKAPKKMLNVYNLLNLFILKGGSWEALSAHFKKFNVGYLAYVLYWMARHSARDDPDPNFPDIMEKIVLEMHFDGKKVSEIKKIIKKESSMITSHIEFVLKTLVEPNNMKFFRTLIDAFPPQIPHGSSYDKNCIPSYVSDLITPSTDTFLLPRNLKVRKFGLKVVEEFQPPSGLLRLSKAIKIFYNGTGWQNELWHTFPSIPPGYFVWIMWMMMKKLRGVEDDDGWSNADTRKVLMMQSSGIPKNEMLKLLPDVNPTQIRTKLNLVERNLNSTNVIKDFLEEYPKLSAKSPSYDDEMFPLFVDEAIKAYLEKNKK